LNWSTNRWVGHCSGGRLECGFMGLLMTGASVSVKWGLRGASGF
jgi:hypothetical protein